MMRIGLKRLIALIVPVPTLVLCQETDTTEMAGVAKRRTGRQVRDQGLVLAVIKAESHLHTNGHRTHALNHLETDQVIVLIMVDRPLLKITEIITVHLVNILVLVPVVLLVTVDTRTKTFYSNFLVFRSVSSIDSEEVLLGDADMPEDEPPLVVVFFRGGEAGGDVFMIFFKASPLTIDCTLMPFSCSFPDTWR